MRRPLSWGERRSVAERSGERGLGSHRSKDRDGCLPHLPRAALSRARARARAWACGLGSGVALPSFGSASAYEDDEGEGPRAGVAQPLGPAGGRFSALFCGFLLLLLLLLLLLGTQKAGGVGSMSLSGFFNAPVSKGLLLVTVGSTVLAQLTSARQASYQLTLAGLYGGQLWRFITSQLAFGTPSELIVGLMLSYMARTFERQMGSRKFGAFVLVRATAPRHRSKLAVS
mmetsp:Transcript_31849/g.101328  ORF Transcript_31849/g.101328 Transcript_31849/m.101328 type:complete len:229 (+) Transcript_31849:17-703(+)